ncbi:MAG: DUF1697 domain-containing protein [Terriglobales bacterium]
MLRGINVGGHKIVKMDLLRKAFEAMGFADVATYIQSGSVVFKTPAKAGANLSKQIQLMLLRKFGMAVSVIVRTSEEIGDVADNNPFLKEAGIDASKLHVCFLSSTPQNAAVKGLDTIAAGADRFNWRGREIYIYCPNGFGGTKLSINAFEKVLSVRATTRNWKTVNKLWEMTQ